MSLRLHQKLGVLIDTHFPDLGPDTGDDLDDQDVSSTAGSNELKLNWRLGRRTRVGRLPEGPSQGVPGGGGGEGWAADWEGRDDLRTSPTQGHRGLGRMDERTIKARGGRDRASLAVVAELNNKSLRSLHIYHEDGKKR